MFHSKELKRLKLLKDSFTCILEFEERGDVLDVLSGHFWEASLHFGQD